MRVVAVRWWMGWMLAVQAVFSHAADTERAADPAPVQASAEARATLSWVLDSADHGALPFAIVDKKNARLFVFHGDGRLIGASPALLGLAPGDHSVPGAGQRVSQLAPDERTTPAGRFRSEPGHNLDGDDIVWVDYDAAIAIHRVRPGAAQERREQRLASPTAADNRVSLGCIVVPVAFYDTVVKPVLGRQRGVVYVLPETQPAQAMLNALRAGVLKGS